MSFNHYLLYTLYYIFYTLSICFYTVFNVFMYL
nr:MAG TPA: hypothetical protein [Caudoviricetes sp.]